MRVHLSFDVEIWCNGWRKLDEVFPGAYQRYVYGRSKHGDYALPKTLEILGRHGLGGVFFVEPLFAARFGVEHLARIVGLIEQAGQDVQLHLHPEWTDEIRPALLADVSAKRQHLTQYDLDEQTQLIGTGKRMLESLTGRPVTAFRAGSYACNADTYKALHRLGVGVDSSLNEIADVSGVGMGDVARAPQLIDGVLSCPVSVFRDGFGRLRPAQVGACSFAEMRDALLSAHDADCPSFVIVSHNFEMLKPGSSERDAVVARRFDALCAFLAAHPDLFEVGSYPGSLPPSAAQPERASAKPWSTARRYAEQALRRLS
jgi:hypothetical protein